MGRGEEGDGGGGGGGGDGVEGRRVLVMQATIRSLIFIASSMLLDLSKRLVPRGFHNPSNL